MNKNVARERSELGTESNFHKKDGGSWTPDSTYILLFLSLTYSNIYFKENVSSKEIKFRISGNNSETNPPSDQR